MGSKVSDNIAATLAFVASADVAPTLTAVPAALDPVPPKQSRKATRAGKLQTDNDGHRQRLRQRLLERGAPALSDHELIEALLMLARPRIDTKPIAKYLLAEFGSIEKLLAADPDALKAMPNVGEVSATAIKLVQAISQRAFQAQTRDAPVLANWQALLDYLRADMGALIHERVRILYLDSKNRLIRDHLMSDGSVDQSAIYVREVVKRALDLGAASLILVHNHPSGDPSPSRQDIAITKEIVDACRRLGVMVHDHVIIAGDAHISLKSKGLL